MEHLIAIRRCTVGDAAMLSHLASRTFYDTFYDTCSEDDMQYFLDLHYNADQLEKELANPDDLYYVAELQGKAVGYLRFGAAPVPYPHDQSKKALELNRLYVDEAYHGRGIARQLMLFFEAMAAKGGYNYLWLGVWEHNHRAQTFYRKWGYAFTGHRHDFPIGDTPQTDEWWSKELAAKEAPSAPGSLPSSESRA